MSNRKSISSDTKKVIETALLSDSKFVKQSLKEKYGLNHIIGNSGAIQELKYKIKKVSSCDVNVLIFGENGTGKELVARAIHYLSLRSAKPFVPVNCGAIPENLFENEFFGHIKGAFTDAGIKQTGIVQEAEDGTLYLDEISVISNYIQIKLLRLLQFKEYKSLGDSSSRKANIRIIASTNRNLQDLVKERKFREDLYYRLNVVTLFTTPLRDKKEDIPLLVEHYVKKYSKAYNKPVKKISQNVMNKLIDYSWPGNIREIENIIQQFVVMSSTDLINTVNLPFIENENKSEISIDHFNKEKKKVIYSFEINYLIKLLKEQKGNVVSAANKAGKSRTALWNLLKKYNLSPKQFHN